MEKARRVECVYSCWVLPRQPTLVGQADVCCWENSEFLVLSPLSACPGMASTAATRELAQLWRTMTKQERRPYW